MSITTKIHQGTGKLTGVSLCHSCAHSRITVNRQGELVRCNADYGKADLIKSTVIRCSRYYNDNMPSLASLEETAWIVSTSSDGRKIGFKAPEKK